MWAVPLLVTSVLSRDPECLKRPRCKRGIAGQSLGMLLFKLENKQSMQVYAHRHEGIASGLSHQTQSHVSVNLTGSAKSRVSHSQ